MKKIIAFLFMSISVLYMLVSCNQDTTLHSHENDQDLPHAAVSSYDKFVYRLEYTEIGPNNPGMPLKVNLHSGKTTTACIDPLCMHDSEDCPFYACMGCMIDGEIIFFQHGQLLRGENGYTGTEKLCTYHVATGEVHSIAEYTDSIIFLDVFEDILYYYTAEWEEMGDTLVCTYHLHRADGKTGKITALTLPETYTSAKGYTDNRDYPNILTIDGETIYWYKYSADMHADFYTSDMDAGNWTKLEEGVKTFANVYHNGYGYSIGTELEMIDPEIGAKKDNFIYSYYLVRKKLGAKTAEEERIADNMGSSNFIATDRYIYTMESLAEAPENLTFQKNQYAAGQTIIMGSSPATYEIMNGCRIWRMNHDGSERILIAETDAYYFVQSQQNTHDEIMFGYYENEENTWLALFFMEKNENGELTLSHDTLILDTASGIFTVSEYIH